MLKQCKNSSKVFFRISYLIDVLNIIIQVGGISLLAALLVLEFLLYLHMAPGLENVEPDLRLEHQRVSSATANTFPETTPEQYLTRPLKFKRRKIKKRFKVAF